VIAKEATMMLFWERMGSDEDAEQSVWAAGGTYSHGASIHGMAGCRKDRNGWGADPMSRCSERMRQSEVCCKVEKDIKGREGRGSGGNGDDGAGGGRGRRDQEIRSLWRCGAVRCSVVQIAERVYEANPGSQDLWGCR
jgi:hypothetical protein